MVGDETAGRRRRLALLAATWALMCVVSAYLIVPASVLPLLMSGLGVGPTAASWVVSVLFLAEVVCGIPVGMVLDRADNRVAVAVVVLVEIVAMAWGWQAALGADYYLVLASRAAAGVASITLWTATVNVVGNVTPPERQGTAITLFAASVPAGFALGQAGGPVVAAAFGWPATFVAFAPLTLLALSVFWVAGRGVDTGVDVTTPTAADFRRVLTDRAVIGVSVASFTAFSVYLVVNNWAPKYLSETFGVSLTTAGVVVAGFVGAGVLGRGVSGWLSDRVFGGRRRPVIVFGLAVATPALVAVPFLGSLALVAAALLVAGFFIQVGMALFYAYARELVAANVVGTALATLNVVSYFGYFSGPIVTGTLIERTGSYLPVFGYAAALGVVGLLLLWVVPEANATT